ncbi:MAG TPA: hypothetical protein VG294_13725 [Solirubrobacteraceae bacterium]|jgi:hypothetical protein|nr:hypothetical protein [Solirubrobacteraceae bacterium]
MTCPLCGGSTEAAFTTTDRNRALTRERFEYRRCVACGTYFLANVPADLSAYYPRLDESREALEALRSTSGLALQTHTAATRN